MSFDIQHPVRRDDNVDESSRIEYFDRMCSKLSDAAEPGYKHEQLYRIASTLILRIEQTDDFPGLRRTFQHTSRDAETLEEIAEEALKKLDRGETPEQIRQFLARVWQQPRQLNPSAADRLNCLVSWVRRDDNAEWQKTDVLVRAFQHLAVDARCQMDVYRAANYYNRAEALQRLAAIRQDALNNMLIEFGVSHNIVRLSRLCELTQFYGERVATYYDKVTEPAAETSGNPAEQDDTVSEMLHGTLQNIFRVFGTRDIELNCLFESVSIGMFPSRSSTRTIELRTRTVLLLISEWQLFCQFEEFHGDLLGYISCVLRAAHRYTPVSAAVLRALAHVTRRNIYIFYLPYQSPYASQIAQPSTIDAHANTENLYLVRYQTNPLMPYSHVCALVPGGAVPNELRTIGVGQLADYGDIGVKVKRGGQQLEESNAIVASSSRTRFSRRHTERAVSDDEASSSSCCGLRRKSRRPKPALKNFSVADSQLSEIGALRGSTRESGTNLLVSSTGDSSQLHFGPHDQEGETSSATMRPVTDHDQSSLIDRTTVINDTSRYNTYRVSLDVADTTAIELESQSGIGASATVPMNFNAAYERTLSTNDSASIRYPGAEQIANVARSSLMRLGSNMSTTSNESSRRRHDRELPSSEDTSIATATLRLRNSDNTVSPFSTTRTLTSSTIGRTTFSTDEGVQSERTSAFATLTSNRDTSAVINWQTFAESFRVLPRFSVSLLGRESLQRPAQQTRRKQDNMTIYGNRTDLMLAKYDALVELLGRERERSDEFYTVVVRRVSNHVMYELLRLRLRPNAATSSATARETESETSETIAAYEETKAALQAAMAATFTERPRLFKDVWKRLNDLQTTRCRRCRRLLKQSDTANIRSEFAELNKLEELFEQLEQELVKWITEKGICE